MIRPIRALAAAAGVAGSVLIALPVAGYAQTPAPGPVTVEIMGHTAGAGPKDKLGSRVHLAALRGASWLVRNQRPTGRYLYGLHTAVSRISEQDSYLRQAGCAYAVARAGRYSRDPRYGESAKQAIRVLLKLTTRDKRRHALSAVARTLGAPTGRVVPGELGGATNRFGGSALLLLAMSELDDTSEFAREMVGLSRFLESRQTSEGWFRVSARGPTATRQSLFPGEGLLALARTYKHTKRDASLQAVMRALPWYRQYWRNESNRQTEFFAWQCSAFSEAYLITRDPTCAAYVYDLADWMLALQYRPNKAPSEWVGGFAGYVPPRLYSGQTIPGQQIPRMPRNNTGSYAEGLADACRLAKAAGDQERLKRYKQSLVAAMEFLMTLQYTEANSAHFSARYMPLVYGAVRESLVEGDIRCDYTQHAACAWLQYLMGIHESD